MDTNKTNGIVAKNIGIGFGGLINLFTQKVTDALYCLQQPRLARLESERQIAEENAKLMASYVESHRQLEENAAFLKTEREKTFERFTLWCCGVGRYSEAEVEKFSEIIEAENGGEA